MKKTHVRILGFASIFVGILGVIHHLIVSGKLFNLGDILHHEFFEAIAFTAGITLIITSLFNNNET